MHNENYPFRGLVLEGGGSTGIGHIGALEVLENLKILPKITHFVGSSSGSIIASLLACKTNSTHLKQVLNEVDFNQLIENECVYKKIWRLIKTNGWNSADLIESWTGKALKDLTGDDSITMGEVYERFGNYLEITVTDLTLGTTVYLNSFENPEEKVKTAVRKSCLMPIVFSAYYEKKMTSILKNGQPIEEELIRVLCDGGVLDNYPMHRLNNKLEPHEVLGIKLMTLKGMQEMQYPHVAKYTPPIKLTDYVKVLLTIIKNQALKIHVNNCDWIRTIPIDVGTISSTAFDLSDEDKRFLINNGRLGAEAFFEKFDLEKVKELTIKSQN